MRVCGYSNRTLEYTPYSLFLIYHGRTTGPPRMGVPHIRAYCAFCCEKLVEGSWDYKNLSCGAGFLYVHKEIDRTRFPFFTERVSIIRGNIPLGVSTKRFRASWRLFLELTCRKQDIHSSSYLWPAQAQLGVTRVIDTRVPPAKSCVFLPQTSVHFSGLLINRQENTRAGNIRIIKHLEAKLQFGWFGRPQLLETAICQPEAPRFVKLEFCLEFKHWLDTPTYRGGTVFANAPSWKPSPDLSPKRKFIFQLGLQRLFGRSCNAIKTEHVPPLNKGRYSWNMVSCA